MKRRKGEQRETVRGKKENLKKNEVKKGVRTDQTGKTTTTRNPGGAKYTFGAILIHPFGINFI